MATSGHGIKILNSVSKTHPESSYIAKSFGKTLPTLRLNKILNPTSHNSNNFQDNLSLVTPQLTNLGEKSVWNADTKVKEGLIANLVERSCDFFVRKSRLSKLRGIFYEAIPNIRADLHNSKVLNNSSIYGNAKLSCPVDNCTDEYIRSIEEERDSRSSRSTISCEVLKLEEEPRKPDYLHLKNCAHVGKLRSKSTSCLVNSDLIDHEISTDESNCSDQLNLPIRQDQAILKGIKKTKSDSVINSLLKDEVFSTKTNEALPNQRFTGKNICSRSSLEMSCIQSLRAGLFSTVKSNIKPEVNYSSRNFTTQSNTGYRNEKMIVDPNSDMIKYNSISNVHTQSPSDKWIKSTRSLLRHIKKHVQDKQRNDPQEENSEYKPKNPEIRQSISEKVGTPSVDDLRPLLLVLSNAKQMAYEMKRLLKKSNVQEYFLKERVNKRDKSVDMGPQRGITHAETKPQKSVRQTKNDHLQYCNKLRPASKISPQEPRNPTEKKYSYNSKSYGRYEDEIKSKIDRTRITNVLGNFHPTKAKSHQITASKIPKISLNRLAGRERPNLTKENKEIKTSLSDSYCNRYERQVPKTVNFGSMNESHNRKYEFKFNNAARNLSSGYSKKPALGSEELNQWRKQQQSLLASVSRELNLWRRRQLESSSDNSKNTSKDTMYGVETPEMNIKEPKEQKKVYSPYYNSREKYNYVNALDKSKKSDAALPLISKRKAKEEEVQKHDKRITPESLLHSRINKMDVNNSYIGHVSANKSIAIRKYNPHNEAGSTNWRTDTMGNTKTKYIFTSYFKDRSNNESNNITMNVTSGPTRRIKNVQSIPSTNEKKIIRRDSLKTSLNNLHENTKSGKFTVPSVNKDDIVKGFRRHDKEITRALPENSDVFQLNVKDPTPVDLRLQNKIYNSSLGKNNTTNVATLRPSNSNLDPVWEGSGFQHQVLNPSRERFNRHRNSLINMQFENTRRHLYLKDKYFSVYPAKHQVDSPGYSKYFAAEKDNTIKTFQGALNPTISVKSSSLRSKSADSVVAHTEYEKQVTSKKNPPNKNRESKKLPSYEEYVENNIAKSNFRNKTRRYIETFLDDDRRKGMANKNSGFINYFRNEFDKKSEWTQKKESDSTTDFQRADFAKVSFTQPKNRLQPSELTTKLKNVSSVPEIRNDMIVSHFSTRVNQTKSKYKDLYQGGNDVSIVNDYLVKEKNVLHNNMLTPSQLKKQKLKNNDSAHNEGTSKLQNVKIEASDLYFAIKDKLVKNKDVTPAEEEQVTETQGSVYTKTNQIDDQHDDFQKSYSAGICMVNNVPERRNYESFIKNRYNKNGNNMFNRYSIDLPKVSDDELDGTVMTNHWFDDKNYIGPSISVPMSITSNTATNKLKK